MQKPLALASSSIGVDYGKVPFGTNCGPHHAFEQIIDGRDICGGPNAWTVEVWLSGCRSDDALRTATSNDDDKHYGSSTRRTMIQGTRRKG